MGDVSVRCNALEQLPGAVVLRELRGAPPGGHGLAPWLSIRRSVGRTSKQCTLGNGTPVAFPGLVISAQ